MKPAPPNLQKVQCLTFALDATVIQCLLLLCHRTNRGVRLTMTDISVSPHKIVVQLIALSSKLQIAKLQINLLLGYIKLNSILLCPHKPSHKLLTQWILKSSNVYLALWFLRFNNIICRHDFYSTLFGGGRLAHANTVVLASGFRSTFAAKAANLLRYTTNVVEEGAYPYLCTGRLHSLYYAF
jgi:hypothetical protein